MFAQPSSSEGFVFRFFAGPWLVSGGWRLMDASPRVDRERWLLGFAFASFNCNLWSLTILSNLVLSSRYLVFSHFKKMYLSLYSN